MNQKHKELPLVVQSNLVLKEFDYLLRLIVCIVYHNHSIVFLFDVDFTCISITCYIGLVHILTPP